MKSDVTLAAICFICDIFLPATIIRTSLPYSNFPQKWPVSASGNVRLTTRIFDKTFIFILIEVSAPVEDFVNNCEF